MTERLRYNGDFQVEERIDWAAIHRSADPEKVKEALAGDLTLHLKAELARKVGDCADCSLCGSPQLTEQEDEYHGETRMQVKVRCTRPHGPCPDEIRMDNIVLEWEEVDVTVRPDPDTPEPKPLPDGYGDW